MGITPALITAGASLASGAASLFGSNNSQPAPPPQGYQPQFSGYADQQAMEGLSNLPQYNSAGQSLGQYGQITQNLINNPYAGGYQQSANAISPLAMGAGANILGAGQSYLPYAQQALQTGFDPQQALYGQQFQQNTDQTRAALAARGLNTSPYGAGVEDQSNLNFNNQWLQNALQRQQTAAGTASQLGGAANSMSTSGLNLLQQGAQLPYATSNTIGSNQQGALNAYGAYGNQATQTALPAIQQYLAYLGVGNQSAGVANTAYANQLTAQNNQFNQGQTIGKNIGQGISGLGTYFGTGTPYMSGGSIPGAVGPTSVNGMPLQ